jgi:hypothetical protein
LVAATTVNDADRLARDAAMRCMVAGNAIKGRAASTSQMGRFETELLATGAGEQEGTTHKGHCGCTCCHPSFVLNHFGDLEGSALPPDSVQ